MIEVSVKEFIKVRAVMKDENGNIMGKCGVILPSSRGLLSTAIDKAEKFELPFVYEGTPYPSVQTLEELKALTSEPWSEPLRAVKTSGK